jgi:hypothetical protein
VLHFSSEHPMLDHPRSFFHQTSFKSWINWGADPLCSIQANYFLKHPKTGMAKFPEIPGGWWYVPVLTTISSVSQFAFD